MMMFHVTVGFGGLAELEARSERKRQALRRAQEAAAEDDYGEPPGLIPSDSSNAPVVDVESQPESDTRRDLDEIREELERRNDE
jgi:hypothetical protein